MTHSEFREWQAFYAANPFFSDVQEVQMATLSTVVSSSSGGKAKVGDFMITGREKNRQSKSVSEMTEEDINKLAGV